MGDHQGDEGAFDQRSAHDLGPVLRKEPAQPGGARRDPLRLEAEPLQVEPQVPVVAGFELEMPPARRQRQRALTVAASVHDTRVAVHVSDSRQAVRRSVLCRRLDAAGRFPFQQVGHPLPTRYLCPRPQVFHSPGDFAISPSVPDLRRQRALEDRDLTRVVPSPRARP
jgi:hypothetical protein